MSDKISENMRRKIITFLKKDEDNRICTRDKETKTTNKGKEQKGYLLESMKRLNETYNKETKMSKFHTVCSDNDAALACACCILI